MKVAVISDVHANLPALEAVLADISSDGADELWCLGDLTGYGGDPGPCLEIVLDRVDISLSGNHDMVITGEIKLDAFSHDARAAAEWTMGVLDPEQL
ncbi:MAG TPA: metallophosphoesterase family protein, partial [Gaiellales bacterium]